jgi:hypothetical protein
LMMAHFLVSLSLELSNKNSFFSFLLWGLFILSIFPFSLHPPLSLPYPRHSSIHQRRKNLLLWAYTGGFNLVHWSVVYLNLCFCLVRVEEEERSLFY